MSAARKLILPPERELIVPANVRNERVQGARIITLPRRIRRASPRSKQGGFIVNPYAYNPGTAAILLLNWDTSSYAGSDPVYTEESTYARSMNGIASSNFTVSSSSPKFGSYAHSDGCIYTASASSDFKMGSSDFTLQLWLKRNGSVNTVEVATVRLDNATNNLTDFSIRWYIDGSGRMQGYIVTGSGATVSSFWDGTGDCASLSWNNNTWRHFAIERYGSTVTGFVDGVINHSESISGSAYDPGNLKFTLCGMCNTQGTFHKLGAGVDGLQWAKKALYQGAAFTPPASPPGQYV